MTLDADLRALQRTAEAHPDDLALRRSWREALLRAGREDEAGIEVGDVVHQRTDPALDKMRDGSEYDGGVLERGWFSLVVTIQSAEFTAKWPWRRLASSDGVRVLGTARVKVPDGDVRMKKGTVVIYSGSQESVRLVRPNALTLSDVLSWRYVHDENDNGFLYGPDKDPTDPNGSRLLPHLGPWPMEYGDLRCDAWEKIRARIHAKKGARA